MIYVFIAPFLVLQSLEVLGTVNVGTVLFTKADLKNDTWSMDDVALLRARLYFQHLLPPIIPPQTPNYVETLLKYFKNGYLTISREATDVKTDKILTLAFTDVIGGYMKMFALPIAKYAYYGGTLPTSDTLKLFLFYEDLKNYLGKNGSTWSSPDYNRIDAAVTINVALPQMPLVRSMVNQDPCVYLSYFEKTGQGLSLPTPKIDWATRTMFVPLANQSLIDLRSTNMTDALIKYYQAAASCLLSARPKKLDNFNHRFQLWLQEDVMPHLNDDRLYAPLQGVLSLINNTYDTEAYQNVMLNAYGTEKVRCSHGGHSKKIKIIIAIVLVEIFCCVPTVVYVFFRKKKTGSNSSSSSVNMIFETRTDRSFSDYGLRFSKSSPVKRHGGSKWRQKPLPMMEAAEATSGSHHSMGTETNSCPVPDYEDMATMVDEFLDHRRRKSRKDVPRGASSANAVTGAPVKNETSDDTGKTVTLSSTTGPSKTTTGPSKTTTGPSKATSANIIRQAKKTTNTADSATSTENKPTVSPQRHPVPKQSKINSKLEYKRKLKADFEKVTNLTTLKRNAKPADYLKSQLFKETALDQTSKEIVPSKKLATKKANEERKGREKSKMFKIHDEDRSILIQGGNNPYLEISIDRPRMDVFSVDVSRNEEKSFTKSGSPATPRASRIPKRALGSPRLQVDRYKQPSESISRERKSMIPILKRAFDDSFLKASTDCKVDKLNVTL